MMVLMTSFLLFDQKKEVTKGLFDLRITQNSILTVQFSSLRTLTHISYLDSLFFSRLIQQFVRLEYFIRFSFQKPNFNSK